MTRKMQARPVSHIFKTGKGIRKRYFFVTLIYVMLLILLLIATPGQSIAGSWSIHCTNNSCVATQGSLKVYWMSNSFNDMYHGKLTGVEGIPITIEDFETAEKQISMAIEKATTTRRSKSSSVSTGAPEEIGGGPSSSVGGSQENLFTKKRSISQSKSMGRKIGINYTLALVQWLGDNLAPYDQSIKKYCYATEYLLYAHSNNTIGDIIEAFFIMRNKGAIYDIDLAQKYSDDTVRLALVKYIALVACFVHYGMDSFDSCINAASTFSFMAADDLKRQASKDFLADTEDLRRLLEPGAKAVDLYPKYPDLAFAKWLVDNGKLNKIADIVNEIHLTRSGTDSIEQMLLQDKYIVAIMILKNINQKNLVGPKAHIVENERAAFESAIKSKDQSVQIVTVPGKFPIGMAGLAVLAGIALIGTAVILKKKFNK